MSGSLHVKSCILLSCISTQFAISFQILTDAALLKRQKKEIEELRAKLQVCLIVIIGFVILCNQM